MKDSSLHFDPLYPDVLTTITGLRINMDTLQMAVGIHPLSVYLNQPAEVVIVLQNMIDQPTEIKLGVQLPTADGSGKPVHVMTPKKVMDFQMKPGEVGIAKLPIVPMAPTPPGTALPVRVAVRKRARAGTPVRMVMGGAPPSALLISPFKLQALREVDYVAHPISASPELITVSFEVATRRLPAVPPDLKPTYEPIWTTAQMDDERAHMRAKLDDARLIASEISHAAVYPSMLRAVDDVYAQRGLPLLPGEAKAIAKCLAYTLDDGLAFDEGFKLEDARWFHTLCQTLAWDETLARLDFGELAARFLFDAALYDAVLVGFGLIRPRVRINLGDKTERANFATKLTTWVAGMSEPELTYVYLPLVLGGVVVNHIVTSKNDDPWEVLDQLREAYRERVRVASGEMMTIFDMLDKLLTRAEDELRRSRVLPKH